MFISTVCLTIINSMCFAYRILEVASLFMYVPYKVLLYICTLVREGELEGRMVCQSGIFYKF